MNFIEDQIFESIINFIWRLFKIIGALISYPFLNKKYNLDEIENKFWSGIIGMVFIGSILGLFLI